MEKKTSAVLLLALTQGFLASGVVVEPSMNPAVVGGSVTLSLSPPVAIKNGNWTFGASPVLIFVEETQAVFPGYTSRASANVTTGALTLSLLTLADSGVFSVQSNDPVLKASVSVTVLEPVSNVMLSVNQTDLMEFTTSAIIRCSSSGSSVSVVWMNGSSAVQTSSRVQITDGNFTLTINNVTRYDSGPFRCYVVNLVSNGTSDPVNFTISYGPDNMALMVNGQSGTSFSAGSNLTLLCSAQSSPPAQLQWTFGGNPLNTTGRMFEVFNFQVQQSGSYSCVAFNNQTNMYSSITRYITISKSEQQGVNLLLLFLLLLAKFYICIKRTDSVVPIFADWSGEVKRYLLIRLDQNQSAGHLSNKFSDAKEVKGRMKTPLLFLILTAITFEGHVHGQRIYASENPIAVGGHLTIHSDTPVPIGAWLFNGDVIMYIFSGENYTSYGWTDRLIYDKTTSSLEITSTRLQDSGIYKLQRFNGLNVQLDLSVQELISNVTLSAKSTNLVEFKDSAVLTCSISAGTSLTFWWLEGNSAISGGGGVQLSNGNATLTIMNVTRLNQGPFRCNVSNGLGFEVSPSVQLNISYGPDNTKIAAMSMKHIYKSGSDITLSCSADSSPPATIHWMVNNVYLNEFGPHLNLSNIKANQSGSYTCVFDNAVTMRQSNASMVIQILDPITAVVKQIGVPAILNKSFTLDCEVDGPVDTIQWWKDGDLMSAGNSTVFGPGNKTLTLSLVQHSDGGKYQCQASNAVSNTTSSFYTVVINFGPTTPVIHGPSYGETGSSVSFNCSAMSIPPSSYCWFFDGSIVSNTSQLIIGPLSFNMSGEYTCTAFNNVTGENSTSSTMLTVIEAIELVMISSNSTPIDQQNFTLTCQVLGPYDTIYWLKNNTLLRQDASNTSSPMFYFEKNMLHFTPLSIQSQGSYQCVATNKAAHHWSPQYTLLVNFGPTTPVIHGPSYGETGSSVSFNCSAMSIPPSSYCWFFDGSIVSNTSELIIGPLSFNMSGEYTCMAFNNVTGENSTSSTMLTVIEAKELVVMISSNSTPIDQQNFTLTCQVLEPYDTIYWLKNNTLLRQDASNTSSPMFYFEKNMLHFTPLSIQSQGSYQCVATNKAAHHWSPQYTLLVNFGPTTPVIHGPSYGETGSSVSFNCSAMSIPPSSYCWFFDGSIVSNTSELIIGPLSFNMSGEYTCMAFNNVTGENSTSSTMLTVIEAKGLVMISSNSTPIDQQNFTLTCQVLEPYDTIYWLKNNTLLTQDASNTSSPMFYFEKNMLHFTPLSIQSQGSYQCVATNKAAHHWSPQYTLLVNYGPLNVSISGPNSEKAGVSVSLTCSADSQPACHFYWFFNNESTPRGNGSVFYFIASKESEGSYTCQAKNDVTNITISQSKTFAVAGASAAHLTTKGGLIFMGLCALSAHFLQP
nr:hemicentin-1 [Nothobranchius furzeri]